MMNRGLGEVFYGRRPVQYMRNGGISSGRGSYAGYDPVAAATNRATSGSTAVGGASASKGGMSSKDGTGAGVGATSGGGATSGASASKGGMSSKGGSGAGADFADRDRDDGPSDLQRAIAESYAAEQLANAALAGAAQYTGGGGGGGGLPAAAVTPGTVSSTGRAGGVGTSSTYGTTGISGGFYEAPVSPGSVDRSGRAGGVGTSPLVSGGFYPALSRPEYGDVYGYMPPAVQTGVQTSVAPTAQPEQGGFFDGLGRFFGGMADDIAMGWTLLTQGEEGFIEKYGADALADYRRRSAETMARNEAEAAARGDDEDVFEACPEGFERDPVTQMCVPVAVKVEEEKPEEETKPEPTPSSAETLQDVINRITVGGGGTQPIVAGGGGQNVLPNVDFFRPQFGPRRMQDGGAVDYRAAARAAAEQYGIRPDMFERLILRESNFDPMARSPKGAMGLAQVMPATARDPGFGVTPLANPMDPNESLRFGAEYLSALIREFGGDEKRAVAAYNAGVGRVRKAGGVPDIQETQDYVDFILKGRGPVTAPPPRPANLAQKGGVRQADVARAVEALTPARRAPVEVPPMRPRPTMTSGERMSQLQGGMSGDSLSRAVDSVLSSLMR